jgi:hypothetical protein
MTESKPQNRHLGYARVSTYGQTLDVQLDQLKAEGCTRIYREKASGAKADRRELLRLLKDLAVGDLVTVTRIDRLARSTFDLFAIVKQITDAGAQFRSLAEPWADTATSLLRDNLGERPSGRSSNGQPRPRAHPSSARDRDSSPHNGNTNALPKARLHPRRAVP